MFLQSQLCLRLVWAIYVKEGRKRPRTPVVFLKWHESGWRSIKENDSEVSILPHFY